MTDTNVCNGLNPDYCGATGKAPYHQCYKCGCCPDMLTRGDPFDISPSNPEVISMSVCGSVSAFMILCLILFPVRQRWPAISIAGSMNSFAAKSQGLITWFVTGKYMNFKKRLLFAVILLIILWTISWFFGYIFSNVEMGEGGKWSLEKGFTAAAKAAPGAIRNAEEKEKVNRHVLYRSLFWGTCVFTGVCFCFTLVFMYANTVGGGKKNNELYLKTIPIVRELLEQEKLDQHQKDELFDVLLSNKIIAIIDKDPATSAPGDWTKFHIGDYNLEQNELDMVKKKQVNRGKGSDIDFSNISDILGDTGSSFGKKKFKKTKRMK